MKVLITSLAYLPFVGGAELAVKEITDRIADCEFDLITVNLDGRQRAFERIGRINVYRLGRGKFGKYLFPFSGYKKACELQAQNHYDAVWAIMANQAGILAWRLKRKFPAVKYLLTLQEGDSWWQIWVRTFLIRPIYKQIYRRADFIQPISQFLARRAKALGYRGKLAVIPNGVDLVNFTKEFEAEDLSAFKKELGIAPDDKVVATISRLVRKNGIDTLIKAAKDLPIKILIIGCGKLETKLKALAQEIGVKDKILFIGYVNQRDLPRYLKISDVFVRTSRSEGLGTAFLEAMAAGVPVIGTPVGGITDFLRDEETGLLAEVGNPRDLARQIQKYLAQPALYEKIKANGVKMVMDKYDWRPIAEKVRQIFNEI